MSAARCATCERWRDHWIVAERRSVRLCLNRRNKVMLGRQTGRDDSCLMWKKRRRRA